MPGSLNTEDALTGDRPAEELLTPLRLEEAFPLEPIQRRTERADAPVPACHLREFIQKRGAMCTLGARFATMPRTCVHHIQRLTRLAQGNARRSADIRN